MEFVQLDKVADINPRLPRGLDETQAVSFLAMASVSEDGQLLKEETRTFSDTKKGYTYFERDDVLLAKITPCFENGKAAYLGNLKHQIGFGSTEFHVIRPHKDELDPKYLFYLVWSDEFRFYGQKSMFGAAGQKRVSADFLKTFEIPLPSLPEQRRIIAILDKADAVRRKRQESIRLTEEFLRSVFLDMFGDPVTNPKGWDEQNLEEISEIQSGITKGRKPNGQQLQSVPYMRVANVQDGHIDLSEIKEIDATPMEIERFLLQEGDILLTEGGDPDKLGRGAVWRGEIAPCIHQNHIFRVRPHVEHLLPDFASALIGSARGKRYFLKAAKQTTGIASINKTQLRGFPTLKPPISLQEKFAQIVKKQEEALEKIKTAISQQEVFYSALVQRAFREDL
jgi:type I restriction enzyme S subunit